MKRVLILLGLLILLASCSVEEPQTNTNDEKLNLALMIHIEGFKNEANDRDLFMMHAEKVEEMATILEEYGAKGTFEFSPEFIEGAINWNSNIIQELHDRGHGVGVHADAGFSVKGDYTYEVFVDQLTDMKTNIDSLVDFEVLHVSGICSKLDWVKAALESGFKFTTGNVGYCAMSMPENLRPEKFKSCGAPSDCHGAIPEDLLEGIKPFKADSAENWLGSNEGKLVIFNARNTIYAQYEESIGDTKGGSGEFTREDLENSYEDIDLAFENLDGSTQLLYYGWSIGDLQLHDEEVLREWLSDIENNYVLTGKVEWKTIPKVYLEM
jgi:hypothetical protein